MSEHLEDTTIGSYHIIQKLVETNKSDIYAAYDKRTFKKCVLKIYRQKDVSKISQESVADNLELFGSLNHPNIMPIIEIIPQNSEINKNLGAIIVMPKALFNLRDYIILNRGINEDNTSRIIFSVLKALSYLHSNEIIHRNVIIQNILIMNKKNLKIDVNDVVLSGFSHATLHLQKILSDGVVGDFHYNSPEMLQRKECLY